MSDDNPKAEYNITAAKLVKEHGSKSAAIRALHRQGYSVSEIARMVDVIYQHARNVILRPLKRNNDSSDNTKEETSDVKQKDD